MGDIGLPRDDEVNLNFDRIMILFYCIINIIVHVIIRRCVAYLNTF